MSFDWKSHNKEVVRPTYPAEAHLTTAESDGNQIRAAIACTLGNIRKNRSDVSDEITGQRKRQTGFDASLITLGIGTTAAAFFGASVPLIGGLSIGSGGLAQFRSYYKNEERGAALLRAIAASRCVNSTAEPLLAAQPEAIWKQIGALKRGIGVVQNGLGKLPPATTATADAANSQQDAAAKAIAAANTAIAALNAESYALINAPSVIDQAHDQINNFRDAKRHRASSGFDVASVQAALLAGIEATSDAVTKTRTAGAKLSDAVKATVTAQAKADPASVRDSQPIATNDTATSANKANAEPTGGEIQTAEAAVAVAAPAKSDPSVAALVGVNRRIAALNQTTERALDAVPDPSVAKINTSILACTAGLSG